MPTTHQQKWNRAFVALKLYRAHHRDAWPSRRYAAPSGLRLGIWCREQRWLRKLKQLSGARAEKLEAIGFLWEPGRTRFDKGFRALRDFRRTHPDRWPKALYVASRGFRLGSWCVVQRLRRKEGRIPRERIAKLDRIAFPWNLSNDLWDRGHPALRAWRQQHPKSWPPRRHVSPGGFKLGSWWNSLRARLRSGQLPRGKARAIKELGFQT